MTRAQYAAERVLLDRLTKRRDDTLHRLRLRERMPDRGGHELERSIRRTTRRLLKQQAAVDAQARVVAAAKRNTTDAP